MRSRHLVLPAAGLLALVLASCNSGSPAPTGPTGSELGSATIQNGGTYQHQFNATGTFNYKCTIHGGCTGLYGTVVVVGASTPIRPANHLTSISQGDGGTCFTLSAPLDSVQVGETVTWINNSAVPHNVTSR
jgi:hypothetical protein